MAEPLDLWKDRHIRYFLRCLKTLLPHQYTPNDSNRMTLGFFVVAALDLLGHLHSNISISERRGYANWIYHCEVPSGGFRGFTGSIFGDDARTIDNEQWDPASVPATFFALVTLLVLGDDLTRVKRKECLRWLRSMQREDGSFGEVLGMNEEIRGGKDLRFCCCAAGIRYILRGKDVEYLKDIDDIDVQKLIVFVEKCQTYDGGLAQAPGLEAHAGLTYCGLGALSFLERISTDNKSAQPLKRPPLTCISGSAPFESLVHWLAIRQTNVLYDEDSDSEDEEGENEHDGENVTESEDDISIPETQLQALRLSPGVEDATIEQQILSLPVLPLAATWPAELQTTAGFNGRMNKIADTCYCFWVTGSLAILHRLNVIDASANRKYLLGKTQHLIGGFGKAVDDIPDILHSYLGLASLGLLGESGIDSVDPVLCASQRTRDHLESLSWWRGASE